MSRIGKLPIPVPAGVEVKIDGATVTVKGSKGEITRTFNENMAISQAEDNSIIVERPNDERFRQPRHADQQAVSPGKDGHEQLLDNPFLPDDNPA